jgi:CDP-diacylglycerol--glycerol-3-phosphate 3-phosphatidyltransferase
MNLPNAISIARFPLALLFVFVPVLAIRLPVLLVSAASDWIDGRLARRHGQVTRLGEVLDPIADKVFMIAVVTTLFIEGHIALWMLPVLLLRDLVVGLGGGIALLLHPGLRLPARTPGKRVTYVQFTAAGALLVWPEAAVWITLVTGALGAHAVVDYVQAFKAQFVKVKTGY